MKTAISIPDVVFQRVEVKVKDLGISRSEFFRRAAERYLDELDEDGLTEAINAALAYAGDDDSNAVAAEYARRRLAETDDEGW